MESNKFFRTLIFMDGDNSYTNDRYVFEFVKIVLSQSGYDSLDISNIRTKIIELVSLDYNEEDIIKSINIFNNNEVSYKDGNYFLTSIGQASLNKGRSYKNIKIYVDDFFDKFIDSTSTYSITRYQFCDLIEKFIYEKYNESIDQISRILDNNIQKNSINNTYTDTEKELINNFLNWDNTAKNYAIYELISKSYDFCMLNLGDNKCFNFTNYYFYLDTNIIIRLLGINNTKRQEITERFITRCATENIHLVVTNFVMEEAKTSIENQLKVLINETKFMNKLFIPNAMEFAMESSLKIDFYKIYYNWVISGNKHKNYDGFYKFLIKRLNEQLERFEKDDKYKSFEINDTKNFKELINSLSKKKEDLRKVKVDVNSLLVVVNKRKELNDNFYFIISSDKIYINWLKETFVGENTLAEYPSVWLSIILKYSGRAIDGDYKAYCQFMNLTISPDNNDIKKRMMIKSTILSSDIDQEMQENMLLELNSNYNDYKEYETPQEIYSVLKKNISLQIEERVRGELSAAYETQIKDIQEDFKTESQRIVEQAYLSGKKDNNDELQTKISILENETVETLITKKVERKLEKKHKRLNYLVSHISRVYVILNVMLIIVILFLWYILKLTVIEFFTILGAVTVIPNIFIHPILNALKEHWSQEEINKYKLIEKYNKKIKKI